VVSILARRLVADELPPVGDTVYKFIEKFTRFTMGSACMWNPQKRRRRERYLGSATKAADIGRDQSQLAGTRGRQHFPS
jgi:hypothetical protein